MNQEFLDFDDPGCLRHIARVLQWLAALANRGNLYIVLLRNLQVKF